MSGDIKDIEAFFNAFPKECIECGYSFNLDKTCPCKCGACKSLDELKAEIIALLAENNYIYTVASNLMSLQSNETFNQRIKEKGFWRNRD